MIVGVQLADNGTVLHLAHWAGPCEYEPECNAVDRVRWPNNDETVPRWLAAAREPLLREVSDAVSWRRTGGRWVRLWFRLADAPDQLRLCRSCLTRHRAEHAEVAERLASRG